MRLTMRTPRPSPTIEDLLFLGSRSFPYGRRYRPFTEADSLLRGLAAILVDGVQDPSTQAAYLAAAHNDAREATSAPAPCDACRTGDSLTALRRFQPDHGIEVDLDCQIELANLRDPIWVREIVVEACEAEPTREGTPHLDRAILRTLSALIAGGWSASEAQDCLGTNLRQAGLRHLIPYDVVPDDPEPAARQ